MTAPAVKGDGEATAAKPGVVATGVVLLPRQNAAGDAHATVLRPQVQVNPGGHRVEPLKTTTRTRELSVSDR